MHLIVDVDNDGGLTDVVLCGVEDRVDDRVLQLSKRSGKDHKRIVNAVPIRERQRPRLPQRHSAVGDGYGPLQESVAGIDIVDRDDTGG